ncbi:MAG: FliM/FliN family flagellar motor switch protein [Phyllobacterium sp.]
MSRFDGEKRSDVLAESILRAAGISVDDLKSLGSVFKDAATSFAERVANVSSVVMEAAIIDIDTVERDALLGELPRDGVLAPVSVARWGCTVFLIADRDFVFSSIEALFGASANYEAFDVARPYSGVELAVARQMFEEAAGALDHVFSGQSGELFKVGDVCEISRLSPETIADARMISCSVSVTAAGKSGLMRIVLPRSSYRPMQEAIARMLRLPARQSDPAWAKRMRFEVSRAKVGIEAYIPQGSITLGQITELKAGDVLKLPDGAIEQVRLRSGGQSLYKCTLGKAGTAFTVRIGDPVSEEEDLIDELAAG